MHYIIAHKMDCDGIISHALLKRKLNDTKHFFADYPDFPDMLKSAIKEQKGDLIVADIDLNPNIRRYTYLFERASRKHDSFSWYDHHDGSILKIDFLEKYCNSIILDKDKCASLIIQKYTLPDENYARFLANLAQVFDYKILADEQYKLASKLQQVIKSGFDLDELVNLLSIDDSWQTNGDLAGRLEMPRQEFIKRELIAYGDLEDTIQSQNVTGLRVLFGLSSMELYSSDAPMHIKQKMGHLADLIVVFFLNDAGSVMIYGNTDKINVLDICNSFGGGGRGGNGGFIFGKKTNAENYADRIQAVCKTITEMNINPNKQM